MHTAPEERRTDIDAHPAKSIRNVVAVTDQAAVGGILTKSINRRNRMTRRERNDLIAPAEKKSACADDERTCPLPHKARKCRVDVTRSADIQHNKLQAKSTRGRLHFVHLRGIRNIQVHEQSDDGRIGDEFVQQRELLRHQIDTVAAEGSISLVLS
jgi:hypothetical protein